MSFDLNKIAKTIYATTPADLVFGLNRVFNLGIVEEKSFFGSLFNIHLVIGKDPEESELYFSNRDDLLAWIMSVVKTDGNLFHNYIDRFESRLVLADDVEFPEELDETAIESDLNCSMQMNTAFSFAEPQAVVDSDSGEGSFEEVKEPTEPFEFTKVPEEFETESILEEKIEDESAEETKEPEEPNWKYMSGPKFSKENIVELAKSSYGIELNIEDKKPTLLADFKEQYEQLKK